MVARSVRRNKSRRRRRRDKKPEKNKKKRDSNSSCGFIAPPYTPTLLILKKNFLHDTK